jgi:uncharacterized protein YndB with AHSA1/START domain
MKLLALAVAGGLAGSICGSASVADASANGFTVKVTVTVQAAPDAVYRALVQHVGDWWDPAHTFSRDAHNLSIDPKPMGCFCEKLPNQGGVRHMEVIHIIPGKTLVMSGAIGPLQSLAASGTMTVGLEPANGGTKLEVIYALSGYLPAGLNTFAAPVDMVITQQFTRLKNYVEHGDPAPRANPGGGR